MRNRALGLVLTAALVLTATPASATPQHRVDLKTMSAATVTAGSSVWIVLMWKAPDVPVTDFQVTVPHPPAGVTIEYPWIGMPATPGTFTSLYHSDRLGPGEMDYTALRLTVPYDARKFRMNVRASYTVDGRTVAETKKVEVPVVTYKGTDVAQVTTDGGSVVAGDATWISISYAGMAPSAGNFRLTAAAPAAFTISYPSDRSATSLNRDDQLEWGETDVARFRLDTTGVEPGVYTIDLTANYTKGAETLSLPGSVTVSVVAP